MRVLEVEEPDHESMSRVLAWKGHRNGPDRLFVQRVLFGFRVRLGTKDRVHVDYCCGDRPEVLETTYAAVRKFIEQGGDWRDLPRQDVKPLWNDLRCWGTLLAACGIPESQRQALFKRHPADRMDALDPTGAVLGFGAKRR